MLAVALRALPEEYTREEACAESAVIGAVTAAARIVQAYPLRLGEVLPGLRLVPDRLIGSGELRPRFRNALFRDDIRTWGDLAQRTPDDLLDIRGFGHGSVEAITRAAVARIVRRAALLAAATSGLRRCRRCRRARRGRWWSRWICLSSGRRW